MMNQIATLQSPIFEEKWRPELVHQLLVVWDHNAKQGTKGQKNRSAVRGGGKKPWAQKKTGRARAGTIRSPLWRGGGVTFAADGSKRDIKVLKKQYRVGIRSIFAEIVRREYLYSVPTLDFEQPKTKLAKKFLNENNLDGKVLFITEQANENFILACRNLFNLDIITSRQVNPRVLLWAEKVVVEQSSLEAIQEWLK